ncbi:hypothetical protein BDZ91DRAFT_754422 [Kalaharituber pfeilii]|nr:hypothetical protein BDZ91DRAFT_754422 [Kalaharituber pfeilii]
MFDFLIGVYGLLLLLFSSFFIRALPFCMFLFLFRVSIYSSCSCFFYGCVSSVCKSLYYSTGLYLLLSNFQLILFYFIFIIIIFFLLSLFWERSWMTYI